LIQPKTYCTLDRQLRLSLRVRLQDRIHDPVVAAGVLNSRYPEAPVDGPCAVALTHDAVYVFAVSGRYRGGWEVKELLGSCGRTSVDARIVPRRGLERFLTLPIIAHFNLSLPTAGPEGLPRTFELFFNQMAGRPEIVDLLLRDSAAKS
jgi:hypothetical protein